MGNEVRPNRLAAVSVLAGALLTGVTHCGSIAITGVPHVDAQCQVYHHKAELKITNTSDAVAHLLSALITLHNGRQQASDLGQYPLKPSKTALETVKLNGPAGGHDCTVKVDTT